MNVTRAPHLTYLMAFLMLMSVLIMTTSSTPIDVESLGLSTIPLIVAGNLGKMLGSGHVTGKQLAFGLDEDPHSLVRHSSRYQSPFLPDHTFNVYASSSHDYHFSYPSRYPSTSTLDVPNILTNNRGVKSHVKDDRPLIETLFTSLIR